MSSTATLVNFGDGYLLGIGINNRRELKIEVYEEGENGVNSVTAFEKNVGFSLNYKAYFIDRENQLIGLCIDDYEAADYYNRKDRQRYIVLHFDGFQLREILSASLENASPDYCRAALIDGYMYILGQENFKVEELFKH